MIEDNAPITIDTHPESASDFGAALRELEIAIKKDINICFPVCIYSYDRTTHKATVMPLVKQGFFNGAWQYIRRKPIENVTVRNIQCGGFTIDLPVYVGDTGWLFASDRDPMLVMQEGALTNSVLATDRPIDIVENDYQQNPNTLQFHTFLGGFFIPDNWGSFETLRYKDNPDIAVGEGLYIGSSIDTDDGRDDVDNKKYQHGDSYEKKTTSSLVLLSNGGASLSSSSDQKTNQNAHVTVDRNKVEAVAEDREKAKSSALVLDTDNGISIRQDDEKNRRHFVCSVNDGSFLLRMMDGDNIMSFSFIDGKLNVSTTNDINMNFGGNTNFRCAGDVNLTGEKNLNVHSQGDTNVMVDGDAKVTSTNARVVAEKNASVSAETVSATALRTANVNSGETVNIGAAKTTNINAGETVNLAAGKKINVTAPDEVTIVTASKTTVMAKKKEAKILVTTLSKDSTIDVIAEGKGTKLNVAMKGRESPVSITTEKEKSPISIESKGKESSIQITAEGERSDIKLSAKKDVKIQAQKNVDIEAKENVSVYAQGKVLVSARDNVEVTGAKIVENGEVEINGSLKLNGQPFEIKEQEKVKHWISP